MFIQVGSVHQAARCGTIHPDERYGVDRKMTAHLYTGSDFLPSARTTSRSMFTVITNTSGAGNVSDSRINAPDQRS
ncbi:MAG: hypothetical protein KIT45_11165 [Fimbriimonadia bacterium]|nr:hypothetical protein [Fimbriimonadia bacterium]